GTFFRNGMSLNGGRITAQMRYSSGGVIAQSNTATNNNQVQLGNYQESRIRHFHQTLDKYLSR
ncbi:MAG: hypothetical protein AAF337_08755, partial [Pseudomonadota bacterium]